MAGTITGAFSDMQGSAGLLGAFKAQFGSTKAMAQALGISQRSAQRYFSQGKEQRRPGKATRAKMARHVPMQAHVSGQFSFDTPGGGGDTRHRNITFNLSQEEVQALQNASTDQERADIFFEAYGMAAPDAVIGADYSFRV